MRRVAKKICMVGAPSVGKTSLVARYVESIFSETYLTTVGAKIDRKIVQLGEVELELVIWDLAGDHEFQRLETSYLRGAAGYLLVTDGARLTSLDRALSIHERVRRGVGDIPCLLVLNKADLVEEWEIPAERVASLTDAGWQVVRTSAKDDLGVEETFLQLSQRVLAEPRHPGGTT